MSLSNIKAYHKEAFNELSQDKTINDYVNEFNDICTQLEDITGLSLPVVGRYAEKKRKLGKFLNQGTREAVIKNEAYNKLAPHFTRAFEIEETVKPIVSKIWQKELTPLDEFDPNKPFKLLVKVVADWRKISSDNISKYMNERIGVSTSYITNGRVRLFELENSEYGLIYDLREGLVAAHQQDAYLMEDVWGENLVDEIGNRPTEVMCVHESEKNMVYTEAWASKITPPSEVIGESSPNTYNEVIVNKEISTPVATCYFYHFNPLLSTGIKPATLLAQELGLPLKSIPHHTIEPLPEGFEKLNMPMKLLVKSKRLEQVKKITGNLKVSEYKNLIMSVSQYIFNEDVPQAIYLNNQDILLKIAQDVAVKDSKSVFAIKKMALSRIVQRDQAKTLYKYFLPDVQQMYDKFHLTPKK